MISITFVEHLYPQTPVYNPHLRCVKISPELGKDCERNTAWKSYPQPPIVIHRDFTTGLTTRKTAATTSDTLSSTDSTGLTVVTNYLVQINLGRNRGWGITRIARARERSERSCNYKNPTNTSFRSWRSQVRLVFVISRSIPIRRLLLMAAPT